MASLRLHEEIDNDVKRKYFYMRYRVVFENHLRQSQVNSYEEIFNAFDKYEDTQLKDPAPYNRKDVLKKQLAYILATTYHEVGKWMQPVREGFKGSDEEAIRHVAWMFRRGFIRRNYAKRHPMTGQSYFGRGFVQLTWYDNYVRASYLVGYETPILSYYPDLVLESKIAAKVLVEGMGKGIFTGKGLFRYINSQETDYFHARRIINGMDKARIIEGYAKKFEKCIDLKGE